MANLWGAPVVPASCTCCQTLPAHLACRPHAVSFACRTWTLRNVTSNCLLVGYTPSTLLAGPASINGLTVSSMQDPSLLVGMEYRGGDYGAATTATNALLCRDTCTSAANTGCYRW